MILFCADPFDIHSPDPDYAAEYEAARAAGHPVALLDFEALAESHDPARAVRRVPEQTTDAVCIYRGWMLRPGDYVRLFEALGERGVRLINRPDQYRHCHWLPESYPLIEGRTPRTVWMRLTGGAPDFDALMLLLSPFGDRPLILKDFVKSRKHEWADACFIPSASDRSAVERVVRHFLELQGADLNEGLVFREFLELEPIGAHPKSGTPMTREYRFFWLDGQPLICAPHWEAGEYGEDGPPSTADFVPFAHRIQSRFFTMDVARTTQGDWQIIELGDGQVAGLPERADAQEFYTHLAERAILL